MNTHYLTAPQETFASEAEAYVAGWHACMNGCDGRYRPEGIDGETGEAWTAGFLDAMEAEDGEEPEPDAAGYGEL